MARRLNSAVRALRALSLTAVVMLPAWPAHADDTVQSVIDCMRANVPPAARVQDVELTSYDRDGKSRAMKGQLMATKEKGLLRAVLRMSGPPDLAGAGYLLREAEAGSEDQMFVYLPSVGRVRRITGDAADGSLLGTDFSFSDIKQVENAFSGTDAKLEPAASVDGRDTWVLSLNPRAGQPSKYDAVRAWIDRKSCIALKVDFYNGGEVLKELHAPAASLQKTDNYWYAADVEVKDLKAGTHTTLHVAGVKSAASIPSGSFDPHAFFSGN